MSKNTTLHQNSSIWRISLTLLLVADGGTVLFGQGCIAIRPGLCQLDPAIWLGHSDNSTSNTVSTNLLASDWMVSLGYSWFESDRHFRGRHEEPNRQSAGTEVINNVMSWTLGLTYVVDSRFSLTTTLPYQYATRSSLYEHDRRHRYTTKAAGLQDARVVLNYWLKAPQSHPRFNVSIGTGLKIPTGKFAATDIFHTDPDRDPSTPNVSISRPVDQSIQPGDGGWGIPLETQAYWSFSSRWTAYANGAYLLNPRETNGTLTNRRRTNESVMSVADQYFGRLGLGYDLKRIGPMTTITLGGRVEGIPVRDAIGGSQGFRRPGYTLSIEPGILVASHRWQFALYAPVAVLRDRVQSITDRENSTPGNRVHGDAAFADFSIVGTLAYRF